MSSLSGGKGKSGQPRALRSRERLLYLQLILSPLRRTRPPSSLPLQPPRPALSCSVAPVPTGQPPPAGPLSHRHAPAPRGTQRPRPLPRPGSTSAIPAGSGGGGARRRPCGGGVMFLTAAAREWRGAARGGEQRRVRAGPRHRQSVSSGPSTGCQRCDLPFGAGPEPLSRPRGGTAAPSGPLCRPLPACSARPPAGPSWRREAGRAVRRKAVRLPLHARGGSTVVKESGQLEIGNSFYSCDSKCLGTLSLGLSGQQTVQL